MQIGLGSHPVLNIYCGIITNMTIAASALGTAAATQLISSASFVAAKSMEVFNLTGRNLELLIAIGDPGTVNVTPGQPTMVGHSVVFCPGSTAASSALNAGRGVRMPLAMQQGMRLYVRTTENTPITCAATTPLVISFWE